MNSKYLTLDITYPLNGKVSFSGDVKEEQRSDLISEVLRGQIGKGEDNSEAKNKEIYHIRIKWYPDHDRFEVSSDTGNKGLRDGILMDVLTKLE